MSISNDRLETLAALGGDIAALVAEIKTLREHKPAPTSTSQTPLRVGNNVFIRTVTTYYIGRVADCGNETVLLDDASWVADTGRFHIALRDGVLNEVEPYIGPVIVNRGAMVDCCDWRHALPTSVK